jgi:dipeptidase D
MDKEMKKSVLEIFEELTRIPHCSGRTGEMRKYLAEYARRCGYRVETDAIGNVAAYCEEKSVVTLQSHYDMVCIGKAPEIETVVENGWMRAKESSLGADNGMGIAMTLWLMQRGAAIDALFTNDEEIGLIGAAALELPIRTPFLLNLDSEELGKVYIGCAGGEDLHCRKRTAVKEAPEGRWFRLVSTAPGGHSGVNIADGIPNAITELCGYIAAHEGMEVARLAGGERINAIPRRAEALVWLPSAQEPLPAPEGIERYEAEASKGLVAEGRELAEAIFGFAHGVREWNRDLDLPESSVNLAIVSLDGEKCEVSLSARSMDNAKLARLVEQCAAGWGACGFSCEREGKYPAWKPEVNAFSETVLKAYERVVPGASYAAIHAGLECALFAERFPGLRIASIGPTILDPHSDRERVDLASVEKVTEVIERVVADLSAL